jgi:CYTH domain-containing protein
MLHFEIERKFLVRETPRNTETHSAVEILQGYLAISDDGTEVRLRNIGQAYILTVKSGKGIRRHERETELSREQFERLWPMTEGKRVEKKRYKIAMSSLSIELDIYQGALEGLKTAEVEFETQDEADSFTPPSWLDKEVTLDERYKNKKLALCGLPEDFQQI